MAANTTRIPHRKWHCDSEETKHVAAFAWQCEMTSDENAILHELKLLLRTYPNMCIVDTLVIGRVCVTNNWFNALMTLMTSSERGLVSHGLMRHAIELANVRAVLLFVSDDGNFDYFVHVAQFCCRRHQLTLQIAGVIGNLVVAAQCHALVYHEIELSAVRNVNEDLAAMMVVAQNRYMTLQLDTVTSAIVASIYDTIQQTAANLARMRSTA